MAVHSNDAGGEPTPSTAAQEYTDRLVTRSGATWKRVLNVQAPYQWNIRRLCRGRTLDVGCGIGRYLQSLDSGSIGIDHNPASVQVARGRGLHAYVTDEFLSTHSPDDTTFDSLLVAHVLEHLTPEESRELLEAYLPFLGDRGRVVLICPQERGYASDHTHVTWLDVSALAELLAEFGYGSVQTRSFPLPRSAGRLFTHNESIVVGTRQGVA